MVDYEKLNEKIRMQAEKVWDTASIEAWLRKITTDGIPKRVLDTRDIVNRKDEILNGVQHRAEDCTFLSYI